MDHGEADEGGSLAGMAFVVACQPAAAADPGEGPFGDRLYNLAGWRCCRQRDRAEGGATTDRRWNAEHHLDVVAIDFDPPDQRSDDLPHPKPVKTIKADADRGRKVLQLTDGQAQLALGFGHLDGCLLSLLELGNARLEPGDARLEPGAVNHPGSITIDQAANSAPEGRDLTVKLGQFLGSGRALARLVQATPESPASLSSASSRARTRSQTVSSR